MRVVVVGLGVQGRKRRAVAGPEVVATVDPVVAGADYRRIEDVPASSYDAAMLCVPDASKLALLDFLAAQGKHMLLEKPLLAGDEAALTRLAGRVRRAGVVCYTAYNHRFEPHFVRMRDLLRSGDLGRVYHARLFYGNGTARDVRESAWRDQGAGVLPDLGSHLLDTVLFWFGDLAAGWKVLAAHRFENRSFDHMAFAASGEPALAAEISLLSWRNHFTADVYGEKGSAHIESLCKWGPSVFVRRARVLPSGRPPEEAITLVQSDPTWSLEYDHFKGLCAAGRGDNLDNDIRINACLGRLARQAMEMRPS
jgi:scyllo-inositol 2-dehydrogenase (NADP+)